MNLSGRTALVMEYQDMIQYGQFLLQKGQELLRKKPKLSYEEFREYIQGIVFDDFRELQSKDVKEVITIFPQEGGRRSILFIKSANRFFDVLEVEANLVSRFCDLKPDIALRRR